MKSHSLYIEANGDSAVGLLHLLPEYQTLCCSFQYIGRAEDIYCAWLGETLLSAVVHEREVSEPD